jgi:hypothetical protein
MAKRFSYLLAGALVVAAVMTLAAQAPAKSIKVIGCLQRTGNNAYLLKDMRADDTFRLEQNANPRPEDELDFHTGHFIEVTGTLSDTTTNPPRLKIAQIIYLSKTCPVAPKK